MRSRPAEKVRAFVRRPCHETIGNPWLDRCTVRDVTFGKYETPPGEARYTERVFARKRRRTIFGPTTAATIRLKPGLAADSFRLSSIFDPALRIHPGARDFQAPRYLCGRCFRARP